VFDLESHEFFVSRDVVFYETIFPYQNTTQSSASQLIPQTHPTALAHFDEADWDKFSATGSMDDGPSSTNPAANAESGPELGAPDFPAPAESSPRSSRPVSGSGPTTT